MKHPNNTELQDKYKVYKKRLKSLIIFEEKKHYEETFHKYHNNSRQSWIVIKNIINKKKNATLPQATLMLMAQL